MPDNVTIPQYQSAVYPKLYQEYIKAGKPPYIADMYAKTMANSDGSNYSGGGDRNPLLAPLYATGSFARGIVGGTGGLATGTLDAASIGADVAGQRDMRNALLQAADVTDKAFAGSQPDPYESKRWTPEWLGYVAGSAMPSVFAAGATTLATAPVLGPAAPVAAGQMLGHIEVPHQYYEKRLSGGSKASALATYEASAVGTGLLEGFTAGRGAKALKAVDIKKIAQQGAFRGGIKRVGKAFAKEGTFEGAEEFAQGRWQKSIGAIAGINKWSQLFEGSPEDFVGGFFAGGGMSAVKAQMENKGAERFLNSNMEIKFSRNDNGIVHTQVNPTSENPTVDKDEAGEISRMVITSDLSKEMFFGKPVEEGEAKGDFYVTKTEKKGRVTQRTDFQRLPKVAEKATRGVLETILADTSKDLKIGSKYFNSLDPIQQGRLQAEVAAYASSFGKKFSELGKDMMLRDHIMRVMNNDNAVYYSKIGGKSQGLETPVNFRGQQVPLRELPDVAKDAGVLPEELEFVSAFSPTTTAEGHPISRTLADLTDYRVKNDQRLTSGFNQLRKTRAEAVKRDIQSGNVPVKPMVRMFDEAGVKPTQEEMAGKEELVNQLSGFYESGVNQEQVREKLRDWFKGRIKRGQDSEIIKEAKGIKKAVSDIKAKKKRGRPKKVLPSQNAFNTPSRITGAIFDEARKRIVKFQRLANDIPVYFNDFPDHVQQLLEKHNKNIIRSGLYRAFPLINVNLSDVQKSWDKYIDVGSLFKPGYAEPGEGLNKSEVIALTIEHERVHAATGLDGTPAEENFVTALALERIGRNDLAQRVYDKMDKQLEVKIDEFSWVPLPKNPKLNDAGLSAMTALKAQSVKQGNQVRVPRKVRDSYANPMNRSESTTQEEALKYLGTVMLQLGIDLNPKSMRIFLRNLGDFLNKEITLDKLRSSGLEPHIVDAFTDIKKNITRKEAKFIAEYFQKIYDVNTSYRDIDPKPLDPNAPSNIYADIERGVKTLASDHGEEDVHDIAKSVVDWVADASGDYRELSNMLLGKVDNTTLVSDVTNFVAKTMTDRSKELSRNALAWQDLYQLTQSHMQSYIHTEKKARSHTGYKFRATNPVKSDLMIPFYKTISRIVSGQAVKMKGGYSTSVRYVSRDLIKKLQGIPELKDTWIWHQYDSVPKPYSVVRFTESDSSKNPIDFIVTKAERVPSAKNPKIIGWKMYGFKIDSDALAQELEGKEDQVTPPVADFKAYNKFSELIYAQQNPEQSVEIFKSVVTSFNEGLLNSDSFLNLLAMMNRHKQHLYRVNVPFVRSQAFVDGVINAYYGVGGNYSIDYRGVKEGSNPVSSWNYYFANTDQAAKFKDIVDQAFISEKGEEFAKTVADETLRSTNDFFDKEYKDILATANSMNKRGLISEKQLRDVMGMLLDKQNWEKYLNDAPEREKFTEETWAVDEIPLNPGTEAKDAPTLELGEFSLKMKMLWKLRNFLNIFDTGAWIENHFIKENMKKEYNWPISKDKKQDTVAIQKTLESRMGQHHNMIGTMLSEKISRAMLNWRTANDSPDGTKFNEEQAKNWFNRADDVTGFSFSQVLSAALEEIDSDISKEGNTFFYTNIGLGFLWESDIQKEYTIREAETLHRAFGIPFDKKAWENERPQGGLFGVLPMEIQNLVVWMRRMNNVLGDARVKNGFMEDVNFTAKKLDGYTHRKAMKPEFQRGGRGRAGMAPFGSDYEPLQKHRTYAEYLAEVDNSAMTAPGIDFLMGDYVKTSMDMLLMKQMRDYYLRMPLDDEIKKQMNIPDDPTFTTIVYENDIQRLLMTMTDKERAAWLGVYGSTEPAIFTQFDKFEKQTGKKLPHPDIKAAMTMMGYRKFEAAPGLARYVYNPTEKTVGKDFPWVHASIYKLLEDLHADKTVDGVFKHIIRFNSLVKRWVMHNPYLYLWNIIAMPALQLTTHGRSKTAFQHIIKPLPKVVPGRFWAGGAAGAIAGGVLGTAVAGPLFGAAVAGPLGFQLGSWAGLASTPRAKRMLKGLNDEYDFLKSYTDEDLGELNEAIMAGLNAGNTSWMMRTMYNENALDSEKAMNLPEMKLVGNFFETKAGLDHEVFSKYVTRVLFETYKSFRDGFIMKGEDPLTAKRLAASMANNFGGTLQGNLYGKLENSSRIWQFATDFNDTFVRMVTAGSWPVWKKLWGYKPGGINVIFHGEARRKEMQASWAEYAKLLGASFFWKFMALNAVTFALSYLDDDDEKHGKGIINMDWFTGKSPDPFNNEPGKEMSIRTPFTSEFGNTIYIDPVLLREPNQMMELFYSKMRKDYQFTPARLAVNMLPLFGDYWDGKESAAFQVFRELKSKRDFYGRPIATDLSDTGKLMGMLGAAAKVGLPLYARDTMQVPSGDVFSQGMARLGSSVGFGPKVGRYSTNSPFQQQQDMEEAMRQYNFKKQKLAQDLTNATDKELMDSYWKGRISREQLKNARLSRSADYAIPYRFKQNRQFRKYIPKRG